jgi:hypothetical protein
MFKMMRTLILPLTMILLASPTLAEPPGKAKKADGAQSARDYAPGHNKGNKNKGNYSDEGDREYDCGNIKNDDARKRCREDKHERSDSDRKYDCSDIKDDGARKRCREEKHAGKYGEHEKSSSIREDDSRKSVAQEKTRKPQQQSGSECDNVMPSVRDACLAKYKNKGKR